MEFDSEPAAFRFYNEYGRIIGFSIRRDYHNKSRLDGMMINRKFVCSKEGVKDNRSSARARKDTRTNCDAFMYISLDRTSSKWRVTNFDDSHNHLLHTPETVHMMRTQRKLCESQAISVEIAEATGLPLKLSHDLISAQSGGKEFVGFMREDLKSHLRSRRGRDLQYGEAGILLKYFQAAKVYTPPLFDLFHKEFDISTGCTCKVIKLEVLGDEIRCVIQKHDEEREYVVLGSVELDAIGAKTLTEVRCSCRKFESFGILCGHAIRVLSHMNVMEVPVKYILSRWRLDAKSCSSKGKEVMVEENDRKLVILARYRHLCPKMVTLAARASEDDEAYKLVTDTIMLLCAQVDDITLSKHGVGASSSGPDIDMGLDLIDPNLKKAKGLKKKVTNRGIKGGKRLKAWHEKIKKKANGVPRSHFSQDGETPYYPQMAHLLSQASCSTQVSEEKAFERAGDISTDHSIHIPMEAELFNDEGFIDFMANSQPPSQY